jgi:hypothetical protein
MPSSSKMPSRSGWPSFQRRPRMRPTIHRRLPRPAATLLMRGSTITARRRVIAPTAAIKACSDSPSLAASATGPTCALLPSSRASSAAVSPQTHIIFVLHNRGHLGATRATSSWSQLCRIHHRLVHRVGNETAWWGDAGIDPISAARKLWERTRLLEARSARKETERTDAPGQSLESR